MKHRFNRIFKLVVAFLLILSLGSPAVISSARHTHHSQVRTSRHIRQKLRKCQKSHHNNHQGSLRLRRQHKLTRKQRRQLSQRQINRNQHEIYSQTIKDINNDRRQYSIPRLHVNHQLSRIGTIRSRQLERYFSHNVPNQNNEAKYLLQKRHVNHNYYGENIASSPMGTITSLAVGPYNTPDNATQRYITYHAKNGYQIANNINNASMEHDSGDANGHRANDLSNNYTQIGVGVSYNQQDQNYYVAVEFIG